MPDRLFDPLWGFGPKTDRNGSIPEGGVCIDSTIKVDHKEINLHLTNRNHTLI